MNQSMHAGTDGRRDNGGRRLEDAGPIRVIAVRDPDEWAPDHRIDGVEVGGSDAPPATPPEAPAAMVEQTLEAWSFDARGLVERVFRRLGGLAGRAPAG